MSTSSTALFIEPRGTLLDAILERKAWLERTMPGQLYCAHPPHCTVLFGNYQPPDQWLDALSRQIGSIPAFELETDAWQQFPRDALAGGGHTIAYRVRLTPLLAHLQQVVAGCLAPFVTTDADAHPLSHAEPFASSLREFGSPFVGAHWIPHFTIGSPMVAPDDPLLTSLMAGPVRHRFIIRDLSVWLVAGERHERLHELALAGS